MEPSEESSLSCFDCFLLLIPIPICSGIISLFASAFWGFGANSIGAFILTVPIVFLVAVVICTFQHVKVGKKFDYVHAAAIIVPLLFVVFQLCTSTDGQLKDAMLDDSIEDEFTAVNSKLINGGLDHEVWLELQGSKESFEKLITLQKLENKASYYNPPVVGDWWPSSKDSLTEYWAKDSHGDGIVLYMKPDWKKGYYYYLNY